MYILCFFTISSPNRIAKFTAPTSVSYSRNSPYSMIVNRIIAVLRILWIPLPSINVSILALRHSEFPMNLQYSLQASNPQQLFWAPLSMQILSKSLTLQSLKLCKIWVSLWLMERSDSYWNLFHSGSKKCKYCNHDCLQDLFLLWIIPLVIHCHWIPGFHRSHCWILR